MSTPSNEEIYYGHKKSRCGGELDVDMNAGSVTSDTPVENVYWPVGGAPLGAYRVEAVNFGYHTSDHSPYEYTVKVKINDKVEFYNGTLSRAGQKNTVCSFNYTGKPKVEEKNKGQKQVDKYAAYDDEVILKDWKKLLPEERILILQHPKAIVDVMLGAVAIARGKRTLDEYVADLKKRGQDEVREKEVVFALAPFYESLKKKLK